MSKKKEQRVQQTEAQGVSLIVQLFIDHVQSLSPGELFELGGGRHIRRTKKGFTLVDEPVPKELVEKVKYTVSSAGFASVHMNGDSRGKSGRCTMR